MKKIINLSLLFALMSIFSTGVFSQNQLLTVGNSCNEMNQTLLLFQNDNQITIRFDLNQIELIEVETDYGNALIATSNRAPLILEKGAPELFYLTSTFIIPDMGSSELDISYGSFTDFENIEIAPSKGNLSRSIDPQTVPFVKGDTYQRDEFYPGTLASLREPFIMRDVRGESLDVFPIQYNPVTKVLRIYSEITVTVHFTAKTGVNEFTTQKRHATVDHTFQDMYNNLFINYSSLSRG
jgi:gingipain R